MHRNPPCHQFPCNSPIRRNLYSFIKLLALALVLAACLTRTAAAQTTYTIIDLGTLGGTSSVGNGINASGQVTGHAATPNDARHAFVISPPYSSMTDLGTLGGDDIQGDRINASGQVTGSSITANGSRHAFVTSPPYSSMTDLGTLGGTHSMGSGINASGQVTGRAWTADESIHAFMTSPPYSSLTDLSALLGTDVGVSDINHSGQVTGSSTTAGGSSHAFVSSPPYSSMTDLGALPDTYGLGSSSVGTGINASGQVTGYNTTVVPPCGEEFCDVIEHAIVISPPYSSMTDLGTLGGTYSHGHGINASGQVVGQSSTAGGAYHAFLWTSAGGMVDLNTLLPSGSAWTLTTANAINDYGQITGYGINPSGEEHAYLLTPATYGMSVSAQSNRNGGIALQGATVGGSVYVFTSPASQPANFNPTGISGVCFWLDNPSMSGTANQCEAVVPYDYAGSASTTIANPWNTTAVANGTHTITQRVTLSGGGTQTSTATFTIANAGAPPPINCSIYGDKRSCNANAACVWKQQTRSCVNR